MEIIVLVIGLILIALMLGGVAMYVTIHSLNLINAMNKRTIFLLEKMYEMLGLTVTQSIEESTSQFSRMQDEVDAMLNRKPEDRYDPHEITKEKDIDLT